MSIAQKLAAHPRWPGNESDACVGMPYVDADGAWWRYLGAGTWRCDSTGDIGRLGSRLAMVARGLHPDLDDWTCVGLLIGMMGEAFVGLDLRREVPHMVIGEWICVMRTGSGMDAYQHVTHAATAGVAVADALLRLWGAE